MMGKEKMGSRGFSAWIFLGILIAVLSFLPMRAQAASNRAVRLKISCDGKNEDWDQGTYSVMTMLSRKGRVWAGMKLAYKVYIPQSLLKKEGDSLTIWMDLSLWSLDDEDTENIDEGYYGLYGVIHRSRRLSVIKKGKNVALEVFNEKKKKRESCVVLKGTKKTSGKYVSGQRKGKYYVITMKDVLGSTYHDYDIDKDKKINAKKTLILVPELVVHGSYTRKTSGYVYLDALSLEAVKTQKVTYNNKDYKEIYACHFGGKDWGKNWKLVKLQ